ncbi:MAG: carboxylating nicotinate-nucleotide diphosphorylase [Chloroflexi bacterium]|nr:carboxylating nicotinate-nucleotide diphosphorylase [Chloroflexota bacterium]
MTPDIEALIDRALMEDLSLGDPTTDALIPPELTGRAVVLAKAPGVLAGVDIALAVFNRVDPGLRTHILIRDGEAITTGDVICSVEGRVSSILRSERTALNFLQRMSGIATETSRYVSAVEGLNARIIDTRKTAPGLRSLDKYAVRMGGGHNHRQSLGDGILIKDNHIQAMRQGGLSLTETIQTARANASHTVRVEVEVEDLDQVTEALDAGAELLLLDNMDPTEMAEAARTARGRALTEASGGITLETVRSVAETGVDLISVGALTHSAKALDMSLDLV